MTALFEGFATCPEKVAFEVGAERLTYGALDRRSAAYAGWLADRGVTAGDRVAVQGASSTGLLVALLGHLRAGVIHVPINTRYRDEEVSHILSDSGAQLVIVDDGAVAEAVAGRSGLPTASLAALPESAPGATPHPTASSTAMLIYTSGTTGRSKGVALSHGALTANVGATTRLWAWSPSDHLVLALPLFHVHGLGLGVLGTLLTRMSAVVHPRFDATQVIESLAAGGTIFMGVPTMYARLIAHLEASPQAAASLQRARLFTSGSAALPASAHEAFEGLTGHRILERYGMSETGFTLSNPYTHERRAGTVGMAVPGYAVRVVDEAGVACAAGDVGEVWVRGDGLMQGYWGQPAVTRDAFTEGWFRTGDVASVDVDGYHRILGRRSADIIKSGGFKVSALEIEDVLLRHPTISEVAVVGLPDPEWGEQITAAIVLTPEATLDPDALAEFVRHHLADYKRPRAFHAVRTLPRNALGKLQKHRLVAVLSADE